MSPPPHPPDASRGSHRGWRPFGAAPPAPRRTVLQPAPPPPVAPQPPDASDASDVGVGRQRVVAGLIAAGLVLAGVAWLVFDGPGLPVTAPSDPGPAVTAPLGAPALVEVPGASPSGGSPTLPLAEVLPEGGADRWMLLAPPGRVAPAAVTARPQGRAPGGRPPGARPSFDPRRVGDLKGNPFDPTPWWSDPDAGSGPLRRVSDLKANPFD